jgi:hypothetical protein
LSFRSATSHQHQQNLKAAGKREISLARVSSRKLIDSATTTTTIITTLEKAYAAK